MESQLVTILKITTPQLGSFVKYKLESEGIECFFTNEELTLGSKYNPDEVFLNVKVLQSKKAVKILMQVHKDYDLDKIKMNHSVTELKKILFPVELSKDCFELCKYAITLASKINAEIKLLYVYEDPTIDAPNKYTASWEKHVKMELNEAHKKAEIELVNFSNELKKQIPKELLDSVKLHYRMLNGTPQNVITEASKRYKPDLILMGTSGKHKNGGGFITKTFLKIIEHSSFPVLSVPISATLNSKGKIKIMHATNFEGKENSSLNKILDILQSFEKEIFCVHIDLNDDPLHQEKVNELNKMFEAKYSTYKIKCELFESGNIPKGIYDFAEKNKIDIISLSRMKHSSIYKIFHTSLIEKLASDGKVTTLIIPNLS